MRRARIAFASALLVLATAGTAAAANPHRSYDGTVCWTGTAVTIEQAWSGFNVDSVEAGIGDGSGAGLGDQYPIPRARSGDESSTLGVPDGATTAGGALRFHDRIVASFSVDVPEGGWSALPAC